MMFPGSPKVVKKLYSADLSSKMYLLRQKRNLFVFPWVHVVILSNSFGNFPLN